MDSVNSDKTILRLMAEKYPTKESIYEKLIYLQARLHLPKGVEHFMSDLHGEYDLFFHIINNCSGVIREKVDYVFGVRLTDEEKAEFCTLIYYPREKIEQLTERGLATPSWYRKNISQLLELVRLMACKYPYFKVRSFIPDSYETIISELINTRPETDEAQFIYHKKLLETITEIDSGTDFICAFATLIKRLAVERLHIVGDFFDRGERPDSILDLLMEAPSVDIQWGNHDVLWMGAALGCEACIAAVVRNSLAYGNMDVLERGYGISLRSLTVAASRLYPEEGVIAAAQRMITLMLFKLEGALIARNPDFCMDSRRLLHRINFEEQTVTLADGTTHKLKNMPLTAEEMADPYALTPTEREIINDLKSFFTESHALRRHIDYLYRQGGMYTCYNGNLLFHSSLPLNEDGSFKIITMDGHEYSGRAYFDYADQMARQAYLTRSQAGLDFMYFLWCGLLSPTAGREFHTFERAYVEDESTWHEPADPYFTLIDREEIADAILREFSLSPERGHIINGHVPVRVKKGESPIKSGGKAIVIDGGFSTPYHDKTGISGYTLVYNSRELRLLQHQKIANVRTALSENRDIESVADTVALQSRKSTIADTDHGKEIQDEINSLYRLLNAYQTGLIQPRGAGR